MNSSRLTATGGRSVVAASLVLALSALLAACDRAPSRELQPGSYRATVELPGGKIVPFGLDVALEEAGPVLYVLNGDERVRVTDVEVRAGQLRARFAGYETELAAEVSGETLSGTVTLAHADDRTLALPFEARLGETWRFHPQALADNADLAGRWDVSFVDAGGHRVPAVADLVQRFGEVNGTVISALGDQRYLAGEVRDESLLLSRFDGGAAMVYEARLDAQGRLAGRSWSDRDGELHFVATRNAGAAPDRFGVASQVRDPDAPLAFDFPDLDGRRVTIDDPAFDRKVLLVTLGASWCPNSHDVAPLLVQLDRKYRERGLAVVGLMFEQHAAPDRAIEAVRRYRSAFGIGFPTLLAGPADKAGASAALPQLDAVHAYPTLLFVDRRGRVRKIHTGFTGPATGTTHQRLVREFEETVELLLAEHAEERG
jgi:thiol-disulfide isomerase/thioredoxin